MTPKQELEQARIRTMMAYAAKSLRNDLRGFVHEPIGPELIARITNIVKQHVDQLIADSRLHPQVEFEVVPDPDQRNAVILRFKPQPKTES